ncbi:MAG: AAA family ATPase [Actinomycetota bacterium]|nr:AAA family ATPase [Actinomycetota bacterium]
MTFTAADLMAPELPPIRWVVPGLLPEGVTLLAGKPKLGKSWLALGVAVAVANGGVALGKKRVDQGEVLYLALEDNQRRLQKRMRKLLGGARAPEGLHISTAWPRVDEGGEEALEGWIADRLDARLVVVDVLKRVRPRTSRFQGVYDADYESLEALHAFAERHGVAVLCVHYLRKAGAADPVDEISGSTGLSGAADGVLVLKRDRGRGDAYLHVDGRDIEEPAELALTWDPNTASWTLAGDAEQYRLSESRAEIREVLEAIGKFMTPTEVAEVLSKDPNTVRQRLWHMSRDGQVLANDGRYAAILNDRNPRNREPKESVTAVTQATHNAFDLEHPMRATGEPLHHGV